MFYSLQRLFRTITPVSRIRIASAFDGTAVMGQSYLILKFRRVSLLMYLPSRTFLQIYTDCIYHALTL